MAMHRLIVQPDLPKEIQGLRRIAMNLWYTWNPEVPRFFQSLDPDLWEESGHNPLVVLANLPEERIREIRDDPVLMQRVRDIEQSFEEYTGTTRHYTFNLDRPVDYSIAYFSMEYGLNECLPIYSGGLGILSGDHLKSASNLTLPLIAVGLLYQKGYFTQYLSIDGWQQESYADNDFYNLPISTVLDGTGNQASCEIELGDEKVKILIWKVQVGRIPLYLLDTSHPSNSERARRITAELYGGDLDMRIRQEIVLGIGGARALHTLGYWPFVYHLNEGHAAFAALERMRQSMVTYGVSFDAAMEAVAASTVFTTHTPVPAGIDLFPADLLHRYFGQYMQTMGLSVNDLLALGREDPSDSGAPFSMAVLALRLSRGANGVSELHHRVSRKMFAGLWPHAEEEDIPIGYVTNGVHIPSYVSKDMADLVARYLGEGWVEEPDNVNMWVRMQDVPHEELWAIHEGRRDRLVAFCRKRLVSQIKARGGSKVDMGRAAEVLNPEALTIGFARRFAPYKRAGLLFTDPDRLLRLVSDKNRPVQFIFAGKAHPRDDRGKEIIKRVVHTARGEGFRHKLVFLEDYDITIARYLVQGVDVWLNTPRRPMEACGTSGMKAAANGALNVSILDGWWAEAYDPSLGWAIGKGEVHEDTEYQDSLDAELTFEVLESQVVPTFFDRGPDGHPHAWIDMMKNSMATICGRFNSHRMVEEYMEKYYIQAGIGHQILGEKRMVRAGEFFEWKERIGSLWDDLKILEVTVPKGDRLSLGESLEVEARIHLGQLREEEILVDLCHGRVNPETDTIISRTITAMSGDGHESDGVWKFRGTVPCEETGLYAFHIRILPFHPYLFNPMSMNMVKWG